MKLPAASNGEFNPRTRLNISFQIEIQYGRDNTYAVFAGCTVWQRRGSKCVQGIKYLHCCTCLSPGALTAVRAPSNSKRPKQTP